MNKGWFSQNDNNDEKVYAVNQSDVEIDEIDYTLLVGLTGYGLLELLGKECINMEKKGRKYPFSKKLGGGEGTVFRDNRKK